MKIVKVGYTATILSALSLLPTLHTTVIKKSTRSLNYYYLLLGFVAQILWIIYGYVNRDYPLLILATYLISIYTMLAIFKFKYEINKEDQFSVLEKKLNK